MEESVEIDAKRILLRYGTPISVLDNVTKEERIRLARVIARTAIPDRVALLRDLLVGAGLSSDDASGMGTGGPIRYGRLRYLYYIVHKDNIASVLASGALLCRSRARALAAGIPTDISDPEVNQRRSGKIDPIQRRQLHDYVNLYFRARNPMLFVRRQLQSDLVVLCVDGRLLWEHRQRPGQWCAPVPLSRSRPSGGDSYRHFGPGSQPEAERQDRPDPTSTATRLCESLLSRAQPDALRTPSAPVGPGRAVR